MYVGRYEASTVYAGMGGWGGGYLPTHTNLRSLYCVLTGDKWSSADP
jgi:hypothetical protein